MRRTPEQRLVALIMLASAAGAATIVLIALVRLVLPTVRVLTGAL